MRTPFRENEKRNLSRRGHLHRDGWIWRPPGRRRLFGKKPCANSFAAFVIAAPGHHESGRSGSRSFPARPQAGGRHHHGGDQDFVKVPDAVLKTPRLRRFFDEVLDLVRRWYRPPSRRPAGSKPVVSRAPTRISPPASSLLEC